MEFMYPVFTSMPSGVTVGNSGLCCCFPCLLSAINSFCLLIMAVVDRFEHTVQKGTADEKDSPSCLLGHLLEQPSPHPLPQVNVVAQPFPDPGVTLATGMDDTLR